MKRMKRVLALGMAVLMCMGLTACGKDFDAAGYTKSVLDANYHAQYDKYAEYRGISESDAKKESDRRYENSDRERIFRNGR